MNAVSRKQAINSGKKFYFTGVPCVNGHLTHRHASDGRCEICRRDRLAAYYQKNRASLLRYYVDNNVRVNGQRREARLADPVRRLRHNLRGRIARFIRAGGFSKSSETVQMLGCTWSEFAAHIERQFLPGMGWHNRSAWHVDHIVALATAETEADVFALNHFTNLRPLWKPDNLAKGDRQTHLI